MQYNPNQFVNQGYQNMEYQRPTQQQVNATRIIPIKLEGNITPTTPAYRGPTMQSPMVIQRYLV